MYLFYISLSFLRSFHLIPLLEMKFLFSFRWNRRVFFIEDNRFITFPNSRDIPRVGIADCRPDRQWLFQLVRWWSNKTALLSWIKRTKESNGNNPCGITRFKLGRTVRMLRTRNHGICEYVILPKWMSLVSGKVAQCFFSFLDALW